MQTQREDTVSPMERELLLTGIGGQGVQLAAQVIARAAVHEGRGALLFGVYGGMMRGGNSDSTVVVSTSPVVTSPPLVSRTWSALVLHHEFWEPLRAKLVDGSVVVVNSSLFEGDLDRSAWQVFEVPATATAVSLGNAMVASMVMAGAYCAVTGLVGLDALVAGMRESVPPYRRQHVEDNEAALRAGWDLLPPLAAPAWAVEGVAR